MNLRVGSLLAAFGTFTLVSSVAAQRAAPAAAATPAPQTPPATKLEGFKPAAGTVVTFGYNELGKIEGISVDVREIRDANGSSVHGLVVQVTESEYREERAFVDADEIPELLKGIDALLEVKANPTSFQNFEVRYNTRGDLQLTAFNSGAKISYAVRAGRISTAQAFIDAGDLLRLRTMFVTADQKLHTH